MLTLPIEVVRKSLSKYLDVIETDRLFNRGANDLPSKNCLTLSQTLTWVERVLDYDLNDCLRWAFAILDKNSNNSIIINRLKQMALLLSRSHANKAAKANLQKLLQNLSEIMINRQTFDRGSFQACFQSSFKPENASIDALHAKQRSQQSSQQGGNSRHHHQSRVGNMKAAALYQEPEFLRAISHKQEV